MRVRSFGLLLSAISIRMAMRKQVPTSKEEPSKVAHSWDFLGYLTIVDIFVRGKQIELYLPENKERNKA
jgi:hypothetical protein